ncbi:hypothetical protein [Actinomycetospora sp. NBRC 106378]|uniref:hypothetical protein n=1 Tax=Actinomycetospora sp. NBRC 106378 TaxID=3032208 RepID=UPI0024A2A96F|nr:hypothetical protein [Actinomycetospora sp. NBRC 106378]GLZ55961.1 hypothetical protein Acsp07_55780 [Actinomycetospora sp. NBRC 106378]
MPEDAPPVRAHHAPKVDGGLARTPGVFLIAPTGPSDPIPVREAVARTTVTRRGTAGDPPSDVGELVSAP